MKIDLNTCKKGDILISRHGATLEYVGKTPIKGLTYLDHVVRYVKDKNGKKYPNYDFGTRTNDGFVFAKNRVPEIDHDIVEIIYKQITSVY